MSTSFLFGITIGRLSPPRSGFAGFDTADRGGERPGDEDCTGERFLADECCGFGCGTTALGVLEVDLAQ